MKILPKLLTGALMLALPYGAHAQGQTTGTSKTPHVALQTLIQQGYNVEFLGNDFGVDGWIVRDQNDQVQYAYQTPEGGLITGLLFAPDGTLHTAKQIEKYSAVVESGSQDALSFKSAVDESNAPVSERVYAEVEKAKWFAVGDSDAPYIYTFMNPTCTHCVEFWNDHMKSLVDDGQLQIRFVPFGKADVNRDASAMLLTAPNAEEIWRDYASGNEDAYDGAEDANVPEGIYDAIDLNSAIYAKRKFTHTPFTIYRAPNNGEIKIIAGVPKNTMMLLADFIR